MPHIVIKTISGPSPAQLRQAAEQIAEVINKGNTAQFGTPSCGLDFAPCCVAAISK